jgi:hypothetical protein
MDVVSMMTKQSKQDELILATLEQLVPAHHTNNKTNKTTRRQKERRVANSHPFSSTRLLKVVHKIVSYTFYDYVT